MENKVIRNVVLCFLLFLLFAGCSRSKDNLNDFTAKNGIIDLRKWDFKNNGAVHLNGEWEFYWEQLLIQEDFRSEKKPALTGYMTFPGYWNRQKIGEKTYPEFGYATLRLTIHVPQSRQPFGIFAKEINTACRLYVDDALIIENGEVGKSKKEYIPNIIPKSTAFYTDKETITMIVQVSNFEDNIGGGQSIEFGPDAQIMEIRVNNIASDLLLFGSFLIMGLYHLALFLLRKKDRIPLFFGLFSLALAVRTVLMNSRFLHLFLSFIGYHYLIVLEILTIPLAAVFFTLYFNDFFPTRFLKYVNIVFAAISGLFSVFYLFTPFVVMLVVLPYYQLSVVVMGILIISILIHAIVRGKEQSLFFLAGFILLFAAATNDVLFFNKIIMTGYTLPFGLFLFIFFQSFLLAIKFTRSFRMVENLSDQLANLDKLKDAFLENTSQELKVPMLGMMGLAETLLSGNAGAINDTQARNLTLITASGRRLLHMVNDLLDFSRVKKKEVELHKKPVDMKEIFSVVFLFSKPFLSNKNIVLVNSIPDNFPLVDGDESRLQQIVHNLVGNAIKFTKEGRISVSAEQKDAMAFFSVSDTGSGIPPEKLEHLFASFEQIGLLPSATIKGTGIGLPITKQLIELHGGTVSVVSKENTGSTFTFSIPVSESQQRPEETGDLPTYVHEITDEEYIQAEKLTADAGVKLNAVGFKKILVVDDEPGFHEMMRNFLDDGQHFLVHVMNGKDALQKIDEEPFDLLLIDLMMPGMSGYLVCKEVRKKFDDHELPIIFITSRNLVTDIVEGIKAGANDYIAKPVKKSELVARIKTHIQLSKISKAYRRFVPRDFLRLLGRESIIDVCLGDQVQRDMTILFSDIRGFMTLSERMSPKENFNFLNSYFEKISPLITKHHGYIDKYIGDGIMAIFPGHPEDALQSALEMNRAVRIYNSFRTKVGYDPIAIGIGLHAGPIMLGTIGDETRMEGTVISDTVNVASRLEGLTKPYGGSIIISSAIFLSLNDPSVYFYRFLGLVQVKGKREAVPIYEIFDNNETDQKKLLTKENFEKGLQAYFSKEFMEAQKYFELVCEFDPYDRAAHLFLNRVKEYQAIELPEYWDGVEKIEVK